MTSMRRTLNRIAVVHNEVNRKSNDVLCLEKSIDVDTKKSHSSHLHVTSSLSKHFHILVADSEAIFITVSRLFHRLQLSRVSKRNN